MGCYHGPTQARGRYAHGRGRTYIASRSGGLAVPARGAGPHAPSRRETYVGDTEPAAETQSARWPLALCILSFSIQAASVLACRIQQQGRNGRPTIRKQKSTTNLGCVSCSVLLLLFFFFFFFADRPPKIFLPRIFMKILSRRRNIASIERSDGVKIASGQAAASRSRLMRETTHARTNPIRKAARHRNQLKVEWKLSGWTGGAQTAPCSD